MERLRIAVLDAKTLGEDLDLSPLDAVGDVTVYDTSAPEEIPGRISGADVVMINKIRLNESNLSGSPVRLICVAATGYDNIDVAWCRSHGIAVSNVVGYSTDSVAQLTVSMALSLTNHLREYTQAVRDGSYTRGGVANRLTPVYHELSGRTWGIAGYGHIGKKVGAVARALGCRVIVFKRTPEEGCECVDPDTLCRESDILSIHLPLSEATRGFLSAERIAMLKREAIVINVARGAVTDEKALAEALKQGSIGGLGVDVYSREPFPEDHPFYELRENDRACFTPHMAWGAYEARVRCLDEMILNIRAFVNGERRNRVD